TWRNTFMLTRVSISIARCWNQSTPFCRVYQTRVGKVARSEAGETEGPLNTEGRKQQSPPSGKEAGFAGVAARRGQLKRSKQTGLPHKQRLGRPRRSELCAQACAVSIA